jgi:hypothetical protein
LPKLRVAVREWRTTFEKLAEGRKRHAEAQTLHLKITEAEKQTVALAQKAAESSAKAQTDRAELERLAKALEAQRELTRQAERVAGFDEHRHDLKPGEPCPLCGASEHPFATSGASFESQLQTARKLLTTWEKQGEKANRDLALLERELAKMETEVGAETKRVAEMRKALGERAPNSGTPNDVMAVAGGNMRELRWAVWTVLSRVLTVADPTDLGGHKLLIPLIDMFNHRGGSKHYLTGRTDGMLRVVAGATVDAAAARAAVDNVEYDEADSPLVLGEEAKAKGNAAYAAGGAFLAHAAVHYGDALRHAAVAARSINSHGQVTRLQ